MIKPNPEDRGQFLQHLGKRAVFRATGRIVPVRIQKICFDPLFEAELSAVNGLVLSPIKGASGVSPVFTISAAWDLLNVTPGYWSFAVSLCTWHLILKEEACDAVLRVCKEKAGLDAAVLFELSDFLSQNPSVKEIPDTVEELREQVYRQGRNRNLR